MDGIVHGVAKSQTRLLFYLLTSFWLRWVYCGRWGLLLVQNMGSRVCGLLTCSTWAQQLRFPGCRAQAPKWCAGLVAPWNVESSQTVSPELAGGVFPMSH